MQNSLEGIIVVAVEQAVAAPYASSRLADAGARVTKIERPEGDFALSYDKAGLAYGLSEVTDVSKHPHVRRVEIGTPEGSVETIAPAAIFNYEQPSLRPVPALGAHTEAVREEVLGLLRDRAASA